MAPAQLIAPDFKPPAGPLLLQLGVDHAITLVGSWLFDANLPHALPLSRESLDTIVAVTHHEATFSHVARALQLMPGRSVDRHVKKRKRA